MASDDEKHPEPVFQALKAGAISRKRHKPSFQQEAACRRRAAGGGRRAAGGGQS